MQVPSQFAVILANRGLGPYIRQHFLDTTFKGLYQINGFDLALLIPYFIILTLLASYGAHRYLLVYLYYKNKKNRTTEPAARFSELPKITVQLPIFNEQFVVERLLEAVCQLDYPLDRLDIQLLDDSTDETVAVAHQDEVAVALELVAGVGDDAVLGGLHRGPLRDRDVDAVIVSAVRLGAEL